MVPVVGSIKPSATKDPGGITTPDDAAEFQIIFVHADVLFDGESMRQCRLDSERVSSGQIRRPDRRLPSLAVAPLGVALPSTRQLDHLSILKINLCFYIQG